MASNFSSEGFDLDALGAAAAGGESSSDEVVYEIGGSATVLPKKEAAEEKEVEDQKKDSVPPGPMDVAEDWKKRGNDEFKMGNFLEAYDLYTEAIDACPCPVKAKAILEQMEEFNEAEREKARRRIEEESRRRTGTSSSRPADEKNNGEDKKEENTKESDPATRKEPAVFKLPPQENGDKLAIYYCNRAATLIHMDRYDEAIQDSNVAILLNPRYTKAFVRRSAAYEKTERTEEALKDAKHALELEPSNATIRKSVARLQKLEDERLDKLKEETMSKLKDLGNSLLGNFGLSLDNFNAVQDPNTGSYSISFNQN